MSSFTVCTSCRICIREVEKDSSRGTHGGEEKCLLGGRGDSREKEITLTIWLQEGGYLNMRESVERFYLA
jgi:hypothetical protein